MKRRLLLSLLFTTTSSLVNADSSKSPLPPNISPSRAFYRPHDYDIVKEEVLYEGWRKVIRRTVQSPKLTKHIDFDVIDQTHSTGAVIIFAWNSTSKTATIIREYMPGCHRVLGGLAAGLVEGKHGGSEEDAARHELEEECHLAGGTWYRLIDDGVSVPMDKYVQTEIVPYLVVDPHHVPNPKPLDDEEDIEIVSGVSAEEILQIVKKGDMNLVAGWGALLALNKLRELREIQ
jgi:8-oxo-dGTP pyrophosphatase MutT (NUDIX family)